MKQTFPSTPASPVLRACLPARQARQTGAEPQRVPVTRPPYPILGEGPLRIVGERDCEGQRQWILAYERYHRQRGKEKRSGDERSGPAGPP